MTGFSAMDGSVRSPLLERLRRYVRALVTAGVGGLVLFHAVLLVQRIADSTLLEPSVALRWVGTLVTLACWWRLRRSGLPLLRGRRALALCLLAALLHVSFPFAPTPALDVAAPSSLLLILPATLSLTGGVTVAVGLTVLAAALAAGAPTIGGGRVDSRRIAAARAGVIPALACRPPPA